jgi:hypothetical protein
MRNDILRTHRPSRTQPDVPDHEQQIRHPKVPGPTRQAERRTVGRNLTIHRKISAVFCKARTRWGISHLEGLPLKQVGNTRFRLVATSDFYDDNDGRGRLFLVDGRDADAGRIRHGRKTASGDGPAHTSPCACLYYFTNLVSTRSRRGGSQVDLCLATREQVLSSSGARSSQALGTVPRYVDKICERLQYFLSISLGGQNEELADNQSCKSCRDQKQINECLTINSYAPYLGG